MLKWRQCWKFWASIFFYSDAIFMPGNCLNFVLYSIHKCILILLQYGHTLLWTAFNIWMHLKIHSGWKGSTLSCSTMWDCAIYLIHPNKLEKLKDLSICQSLCIIVYNGMIYLFWVVSVTYFLMFFRNNIKPIVFPGCQILSIKKGKQ